MGSEGEIERKPRFLCLHGFRTSGEILKKQVFTKWPESVLDKIDLVFVDAPFPSQGKSEVEGIFDPPYYEWFQFNKEFTEYTNFDECLTFIEDYMIKHGPFDGLLGFSQGAILSGALPGMQAAVNSTLVGMALTKVPKIKYLIIIGGAKFKAPTVIEKAYSSTIECPSVHFLAAGCTDLVHPFLTEMSRVENRGLIGVGIVVGGVGLRPSNGPDCLGETDFLKEHGLKLLDSFVDPCVIHHPKGHTIPRFDEKGLQLMLNFLEKTREMSARKDE